MTYTADFRQPRKQLNPLDATMVATITVELFHVGRNPKRWKARIVGGRTIPESMSKADLQYPESSGGIHSLKSQLKTLFDEQLTDWVEHLSIEEQFERDHPTPEVNKKAVATPRDSYGIKGT